LVDVDKIKSLPTAVRMTTAKASSLILRQRHEIPRNAQLYYKPVGVAQGKTTLNTRKEAFGYGVSWFSY
jgi:hypothetical protein